MKELSGYDKKIIRMMKRGLTTEEMSVKLKMGKTTPNSIPSIQRAITKLKQIYQAQNLFQLGYILGRTRKNKKP